MKQTFCDACGIPSTLQENDIRARQFPHDLCLECYSFLNKEYIKSFKQLSSDPEKYKIKYEF